MEQVETARIPFKIKLNSGYYSGEAIGTHLKAFSLFEIKMTDGASFFIEAVPDNELSRYNWVSYIQDASARIVPAIGKFIERHFTTTRTV